MLSLTVDVGKSVRIGQAVVHVSHCTERSARLAIDAPAHIPIIREDAKVKHPPERDTPPCS